MCGYEYAARFRRVRLWYTRSRVKKQTHLERTNGGDLQRHLWLPTLPNTRERDARVVPHDLLVGQLELEVREQYREHDLCTKSESIAYYPG